MTKTEIYVNELKASSDWDDYLLRNSGLPGPRGNLELAHVVAQLGDRALFERYLAYNAQQAPVNDPHEFLAFCGVLGIGRLLVEGDRRFLPRLRDWASDPRWRLREAVAMALQRLGRRDMPGLLDEMSAWSQGNLLERRAAAAALCEPDLLNDPQYAAPVFDILDEITTFLEGETDRKSDAYKALRKGLGYCWSVAVAAYPEPGQARFERWFTSQDRDVRWVLNENLKKKRLERLDGAWVNRCRERI